MRIVCFVFNRCTHDWRVVREAATLAQAGHSVRVLALRDEGLVDEEQRDGFAIVRVSSHERQRPGVSLYSMRRILKRITGQLRFYRACLRQLREQPADVYHAHDLYTLPVAALCAWRSSAHLVYDAHELYSEGTAMTRTERALVRFSEGLLIGRAAAVITVGDAIADEIARRFGVDKPTVVRNCPPSFEPSGATPDPLRAKLGLPAETPIVLYQGGFRVSRGLPELVDAAAQLHSGVVVLLGSGRLKEALEQRIADRGLGDRAFILDAVPIERLLEHTAAATIGVIPIVGESLNHRLCNPNKLYESIVAGVPVAASDLPELRSVITQHDIGKLFDPTDPSSIADCLNAMLADGEEYARLRDRVAEAARSLNWEAESRRLLDLYDDLGDSPLR